VENINQGKRVLVVDDNADALKMICTVLTDAGFVAVGASNADDAVECVRAQVPNLLIIDYFMPGADGVVTLRRCRALPGTSNMIAVMLTADERLSTLEHALARGFDEFLTKTSLGDGFIERLRDVIARKTLPLG